MHALQPIAEDPTTLGTALRDVDRPVAEARGLPNLCYTSRDHLALERERVFFRNWACVGFAKDVPEPGDARPVDLLGAPLFVVRDRGGGGVRAFHNVCSHRGMVLVERPTTFRTVIRCPYHSWCYGLDGGLRSTPHIGGPGRNEHEGFDRARHGLREVRAAVWFDLIFVNVAGTAPPFEEVIRPLAERWREFDPAALRHGGAGSSIRFDVRCNWKLAVENYCESYHLPWVHPGLNSYSRLEDHYDIVEPGRFSGQGSAVYNPPLTEDGRRLPCFRGLSRRWDTAAEYVAIYPNALVGIHRDHFFGIHLEPVGTDRTVERIEIYYAGDDAPGDGYAELRAKLAASWHAVFGEDILVVEGMQRGRASPAFAGGVFSPAMDAAPHCFHRWVAGELGRR